jgi:hypothetical protein
MLLPPLFGAQDAPRSREQSGVCASHCVPFGFEGLPAVPFGRQAFETYILGDYKVPGKKFKG